MTFRSLHWRNRMEDFIGMKRRNTKDLDEVPLLDDLHCEISRFDRERNFAGCIEQYFTKIESLRREGRRAEHLWKTALDYTFPKKVSRFKLGGFVVLQMFVAYLDEGKQIVVSKTEIEAESTHEAYNMILDAYLDADERSQWDIQSIWALGVSSVTGLKDRYVGGKPINVSQSFFNFAGPLIRSHDLMGFSVED